MRNKGAYIWGFIGNFTPQLIFLLTSMVLARLLTPDDFGKIGVLSLIITVAQTLMDSGLGGSLIKEQELRQIDCSSIGFFNIVVGGVTYIVLFFSSSSLERFFNIEGLSDVIVTLGLIFPISAIGIVPLAILQRELKFKEIFINSLLAVVISSVIAIIIAFKGGGVFALVSYQVLQKLITSLLNLFSSHYKLSFRFSYSSLKRLFPFGFYTTVVSVVDNIYDNFIATISGKYLNVEQAGYVYQSTRIEETLTSFLASTIGTVSFPILTKIKNDTKQFFDESYSIIKVVSLLSFPILMTVAIFSEEIMVLLFGDQWSAAGFYLETLTIAGLFIIMGNLIRSFIKAFEAVNKLALWTFIKRIIGITVILIAVTINPMLMMYAYIVSSFIGYLANLLLFANITGSNASKLFLRMMLWFAIAIVYFLSFKVLAYFGFGFYTKMLVSLLLLGFYYLIIMPKHGINLLSLLRRGND